MEDDLKNVKNGRRTEFEMEDKKKQKKSFLDFSKIQGQAFPGVGSAL